MNPDKTKARQRIRELARSLPENDIAGFFDAVYSTANNDPDSIPWADLQPHPLAQSWLEQQSIQGQGKRALVVGCGLGDDAEDLAARGFQVTAFDISSHAIAWCQRRFPTSPVVYQTANLLALPTDWQQAFDFILEIYTIQAMPAALHTQAMASIAQLVTPGGQLLVVCRGRDPQDEPEALPRPLTRDELAAFQAAGLREQAFEDFRDGGNRHFRVVYKR